MPVTVQSTRRSRTRAAAAWLVHRAPARRPRLSIVVPVYNVEEYLAGCLDRILAQPLDDYEVVLVDDGATDRSAEIAQQYVDRHPHLRMIRQANAGLGAARNAGVAACRGEYLTFVDSDDELPDDAYTGMLATLERSGSDFVVGMLKRDDGQRRFATPRMRDNHRVERIGIDIHQSPRMLADVFAVNKIFRRAFWDATGLSFPVGVRYEDQPTLTRAFLLARSFDVVRQTVYLWRIRDDGTSITQRRDDIADLRDRVVTKRDSNELVLRHASDVRRLWLADILPVDMGEYFRSVPGCTDEYWALLRDAVREFWTAETVPFEETLVPAHQRLMGWLVAQDRRTDVETVCRFLDEHAGRPVPVEVRGGSVVRLLPGLDDPTWGVPPGVFELAEHERRWEARAVSVGWDGDTLAVEGFALIRNVPTAGHRSDLAVHLATAEGRTAEVDLVTRDEPRATRFAGREDGEFDGCGFTATVDLALLAATPPVGPAPGPVASPASDAVSPGVRSWRFVVERTVEQVTGGGGINSWNPPVLGSGWHELPDGAAARLGDVDGELVLEIRPA